MNKHSRQWGEGRSYCVLLLITLVLMGIPVVAGDPIVMQTEAPFRYHALLIGIPNVDPAETNQQILDVIPRMETLLREHYGFETQMLLGA